MSIEQLRFVERDGKKVLQFMRTLYLPIGEGGTMGKVWEDVPLTIEIGN